MSRPSANSNGASEPLLQKRPTVQAIRDKLRKSRRICDDVLSNGNMESHAPSNGVDIVQFTAPIYYVEEDEGYLSVDIMRLGSMKGWCRVHWHTQDASAKAGVRYKAGRGKVTFRHGEHTKSIRIDIIPNDHFATTLEMKIELTHAEHCELGQYLHHCRVKIIDPDLFPSNKYEDKLKNGEDELIEQIPPALLLWEYFKLNFYSEGMAWRTCVAVAVSQIHNLYSALQLYVNIYLVDVLFKQNEESEAELLLPTRESTALAIGIMYIVPMAALHLWDYERVKLDIAGLSREVLQENLFRRYLNYSEKSRACAAPSVMQVTIIKEATEVAEGYVTFLELIQRIGKLCILTYFIYLENPEALKNCLFMPVGMCFFILFRVPKQTKAMEVAVHRTSELVEIVSECCHKYRLIAEYAQRPQMCDHFQKASKELTEAGLPAEFIKTNNDYFPKWLGPFAIGLYIATASTAVLDGDLSLGTFLATIKIFQELSEQFSKGYEELMTILATSGPLKNITRLFNMETDVMLWKAVNRARRAETRKAREDVLKEDSSDSEVDQGKFRSDLIPIKCINMGFGFSGKFQVLENVSVSASQGKMIAVVGEHGSGKSTFLRLLGHVCFPDDGSVFIPTHLRILHVSQVPVLLNLSVWRNLTFGRPHADPERVKSIIKLLEMPKVLTLLEKELKSMGTDWEVKHHAADPPKPVGQVLSSRENIKQIIDDKALDPKLAARDIETGGGRRQSENSESTGSSDDIEEEFDEENVSWEETLNYVQKADMHLARALIVNPEVLVLQRPLIHYDRISSGKRYQVIKDFVRYRGVCLPMESVSRRRPRTCFYTPSNIEDAKDADVIWKISDKTVKEIQRDMVSVTDVAA